MSLLFSRKTYDADRAQNGKEEAEPNTIDKSEGATSKKKPSATNKGSKLLRLVQKLKLNAFIGKEGENEQPPVPNKENNGDDEDQEPEIQEQNLSLLDDSKLLTDRKVAAHRSSQRTFGGKRAFQCDVCGYRAKWLSELQKHKLVHTNEKPFPCPHCTHRSRWKGDLTRHIQKIHKIFVQPQRSRKSGKLKSIESCVDGRNAVILLVNKMSPMAANGNFAAFPGMIPMVSENKKTDSILVQKLNSEPMNKNFDVMDKNLEVVKVPEVKNVIRKMVYKCKECSFYTKTASRFHVHVVQHLNKKPYMCSECGYRSNWQWDVTKHIRVKVGKLNSHKSAEVLLIDEAGEKNYEKYKPYMEVVEERQLASSDRKTKTLVNNRKSFQCTECNYEDDDKENVRRHVTMHLHGFLIKANETSKIDSDGTFDVREDKNGELFLCSKCPYKSRKREFINFHVQQHCENRPDATYRCLFCPYWVKIERNLLKHMSLHVNDPAHFLAEVEKLVLDNSEGAVVVCPDEDVSLSSSSPTKKRKFSCESCPYTSNNQSQFQYHRTFHEQEGKAHQCPSCSYNVSHPHSLQQHMKLHENGNDIMAEQNDDDPTGEETGDQIGRMFKCKHCPLVSNQRANVKTHELMHTKIPQDGKQVRVRMGGGDGKATLSKRSTPSSFHCQRCPAKFSKSVRLRRHEALHGADGKFTCGVCAYSVNNSIAFQKHKHLHSANNAPSRDDDASNRRDVKLKKNIAHREWLSQSAEHVKTELDHPGTGNGRLFSCTHCPYVHHRKDAVQNHLRRHIQQTGSFKCSHCDYNVLYDSFLRDHVKLHFDLSHHFAPKFKASLDKVEIKATHLATSETTIIFKHEDSAKYDDVDDIKRLLADATREVAIKIESSSAEDDVQRPTKEDVKADEAQGVYMEAMKSVSNIEDVFSVINEYLHSGGSVSCPPQSDRTKDVEGKAH